MAEHDDLVDDARNQTGLSDFGDDSFREGLDRLVHSIETEATLNELGQVALPFLHHPAARDAPAGRGLVPPPPRDRRRAHRRAADRPGAAADRLDGALVPARRGPGRPLAPALGVEPALPAAVHRRAPDPRIAEAQARAAVQEEMNPPRWRRWCPPRRPGPMECQELMALDFKPHYFPAFAHLPSYTEWLLDADLTSTYRYERRVLKLLQWGEPPAAAVAAEVPVAPAVARPPRRGLPRRPLRDDPPRPHRRDGVGRRPLLRGRSAVQRRHRPALPRRLNVEQWTTGMDRVLAFRDATATTGSTTSTSAPCSATPWARSAGSTPGSASR